MVRPPEQSRNASTNDIEVKPKVRKVKKSEGSSAVRGVDLARTAPVYSPLAVPLAGAASASTSTDSLQQPSSNFRSQSANSFSANDSRHHSQITLPKGEDASKKRSSETASDRKGKKKVTPTYTTIAGSHRREIADAVRNAGLTGTPAAPVSVIIPSKAPANTRSRSDSNLLTVPSGVPALVAMPDRRGGSGGHDLSRTASANTAASASTSSLTGTVASTSSRPRADTDSQKAVKKKKKTKQEPASQAATSQPISGAAGVSVTVLPAQTQPRAGTRSRPPTARPAITADTQLRTQRPATPSNASIRSHAPSVDDVAPAAGERSDVSSERSVPVPTSNLPRQARSTANTATQQTSLTNATPALDDQGEPLPPPWSAPLSTITLAFTPMHAYLADFDPPEPPSPLSPNTSRLLGSVSSPNPNTTQLPPIPSSPPPAFRSRTPSPTPGEETDYPELDPDAIALYERGYNSSETSLDLMDDQGIARVAPDRFNDASDVNVSRYWDARQWEAWRRAGLQLEDRLQRMQAKGKYKAIEEKKVINQPEPTLALPVHESSQLPLAEQAASAGSSADLARAPSAQAHSDISNPTMSTPSLSSANGIGESQETPQEITPSGPPLPPSSNSTQLVSRLHSKVGQGTSRFPSIGSVRRARLKRFEEQRKESKNLSSIIEADARVNGQSAPAHADVSQEARPNAPAKTKLEKDEVAERRESITSGLDRLEALLRRNSQRISSPNAPSTSSAVPPSSAASTSESVSPAVPSPSSPAQSTYDKSYAEELATVPKTRFESPLHTKQETTLPPLSGVTQGSASPSKPVNEGIAASYNSEMHANKRTSGIAQILSDQIEARKKGSPSTGITDIANTSDAVVAPEVSSQVNTAEADRPARTSYDSFSIRQQASQPVFGQVLIREPSSEPVQPDNQASHGVSESSLETEEATNALAQLEANAEQAQIQKQVAEDARLAAELQSQILRSSPASQLPSIASPGKAEQAVSPPVSANQATTAKVRKPPATHATSAVRRSFAPRSKIDAGATHMDAPGLPVLTLPRAPPRVTSDPLSADNLRRLSRNNPKAASLHSAQSASSSSSDEGDLSLSPIASDSSNSDSADGESTARPPASSLLSYTAGSLPPSVTDGSQFDNNAQREVAAASWRRSEDGRRHSAILSRPLSIKRKPPPVPPKRWGGIWDKDTVREVLTQGQKAIGEVVEGATELSRALRAGSSRLSGVQEEDATWETVGREDDLSLTDANAPTWAVVGRDVSARQAPPVSPPKPRRLPPPPPPLEDVNSCDDVESLPSHLQNGPAYRPLGQHLLPSLGHPRHQTAHDGRDGFTGPTNASWAVHSSTQSPISASDEHQTSQAYQNFALVGRERPLPPSGLQRSSATRRPLSFQGRSSAQRSSLDDQEALPALLSPPQGVTRGNLNARPRHIYSSSVPSVSPPSPPSPHAPPPRPRRPLPRPPSDNEASDTSPLASRHYASKQFPHTFPQTSATYGSFSAPSDRNSFTATESTALHPQTPDMTSARPATTEEIDSLPVGRVELERKRTDRTGKIKQKLSCVGINCNRCEICLLQFKEDELACVLPLCLHVFHAEPCTRSYLSANHRCPTCSTALM